MGLEPGKGTRLGSQWGTLVGNWVRWSQHGIGNEVWTQWSQNSLP